jgi:hypothetical protein
MNMMKLIWMTGFCFFMAGSVFSVRADDVCLGFKGTWEGPVNYIVQSSYEAHSSATTRIAFSKKDGKCRLRWEFMGDGYYLQETYDLSVDSTDTISGSHGATGKMDKYRIELKGIGGDILNFKFFRMTMTQSGLLDARFEEDLHPGLFNSMFATVGKLSR